MVAGTLGLCSHPNGFAVAGDDHVDLTQALAVAGNYTCPSDHRTTASATSTACRYWRSLTGWSTPG